MRWMRGRQVHGSRSISLLIVQSQALVRQFVSQIDDDREREILNRYFVEGQAEESIAVDIGMTRYRVRKTIKHLHERMYRYVKQHGLI